MPLRCLLVYAALLTSPVAAATQASATMPPNIVLLVADDHGCDAGCYGNPVIRTPRLDALAAEGVVFDHAFCTTASCSSSRAVILTGLHAHANGQYGLGHAEHAFRGHADIVSLPRWLSAAGYRTARVGKLHVYPEPAFDFDRVLKASIRNPVAMAEACREVIGDDDDRPFFLYFATLDPHRSNATLERPHSPNSFGNEHEHAGVSEQRYSPDEVIVPAFLPDTPACRAELAEYYQSVSRVDQGVGALIDELRAAGEWDNTLFVYLSDHGIPMPGAKTTLYEPGMRSPLVVRDPRGVSTGRRENALVSWTDLTPTLLDAAGVLADDGSVGAEVVENLLAGRPRRFHGQSFLPLLRGADRPAARDAVYGSHTFHEVTMYYPMRVVREDRYKLIWNLAHQLPFPSAMDLWDSATWQAQHGQGPQARFGVRTIEAYRHRPRFELYDLKNDPDEANNLADNPAHAQQLERLKQRLREFQRRTGDPWAIKWTRE